MGFVVSWNARLAAALSSGVRGVETVFLRDFLLLAWRSVVLLMLRRRLRSGSSLALLALRYFFGVRLLLRLVPGVQSLYCLFRQQFEAFGKPDREHGLREGDCCEAETTPLGHDLFADRIKVDVAHRAHMTTLVLVHWRWAWVYAITVVALIVRDSQSFSGLRSCECHEPAIKGEWFPCHFGSFLWNG